MMMSIGFVVFKFANLQGCMLVCCNIWTQAKCDQHIVGLSACESCPPSTYQPSNSIKTGRPLVSRTGCLIAYDVIDTKHGAAHRLQKVFRRKYVITAQVLLVVPVTGPVLISHDVRDTTFTCPATRRHRSGACATGVDEWAA